MPFVCLEQTEGKEVDRVPQGQYGVQILAFPGIVYGLVGGRIRGLYVEGAEDTVGRRGEGNTAGRCCLPDLFDIAPPRLL